MGGRYKFGQFFLRTIVMDYFKFPVSVLAVNTGVVLHPDEDNLIQLMDLWASQVEKVSGYSNHEPLSILPRLRHSDWGNLYFLKTTLSSDRSPMQTLSKKYIINH